MMGDTLSKKKSGEKRSDEDHSHPGNKSGKTTDIVKVETEQDHGRSPRQAVRGSRDAR
jgi:hypothetical protein